jgi:uncharacterized membrane protein YgdD (TMEM256/DUF423 family)
MRHRAWIGLAAALGAMAVAAGAFAAHGLEAQGDLRAADLVETGSSYQIWHALAILACLALGTRSQLPLWLWAVGAVLFPGSLYALALGAPSGVAVLAPVGGTALIAGWAALGWCALRGGFRPPA